MSLTTGGGKLRLVSTIVGILDKEGLCNLGFDIPRNSEVMVRQAIMLNRVEEELPSTSDVELQEIMDDLIAQFDEPPGDSFEHPLHEFLGLDKELSSIRGSLKVETVKKVQLEECIDREKCNASEIRDNPGYDSGF